MNCPECGEELEEVEVDGRQEWRRTTYYCSECDEEFSRLVTYKIQSQMVESDEWEDD